jgi:hypothetical protein
MGAASAAGTVTIGNAYTYGDDGEAIYKKLLNWYNKDDRIHQTLWAMAKETKSEIYLRVVTRVYLAEEFDVSLSNIKSISGGADVGIPKTFKTLDVSSNDPSKIKAAAVAYQEAMNSLSSSLNGSTNHLPGVSVRFTQVDSRNVSMKQTFDRPLVFGFAGFDVKVLEGGNLSAPIPSFAVLSGNISSDAFKPINPIPFTDDHGLSKAYLNWLKQNGNRQKMIVFLKSKRIDVDPADLTSNARMRSVLEAARRRFNF